MPTLLNIKNRVESMSRSHYDRQAAAYLRQGLALTQAAKRLLPGPDIEALASVWAAMIENRADSLPPEARALIERIEADSVAGPLLADYRQLIHRLNALPTREERKLYEAIDRLKGQQAGPIIDGLLGQLTDEELAIIANPASRPAEARRLCGELDYKLLGMMR